MTDQQVQDKLADKVAVDTVVTPGPGAINWRDVGYGALYSVLAALIPLIQQMIDSWKFDPQVLLKTAMYTFLGYLTAKFFSPTKQITTYKKP